MPAISAADYATLSAMITPALLLTANGSLVISTSNRMSRVVDRTRVLNDLCDNVVRGKTDLDYVTERLEHWQDQIERLIRRGDHIRYALILLYGAISVFVCTSLAIAADVTFGNRMPAVPTITAVAGVIMMFCACVNLLQEALEAFRSNRLEVRFFREIRARRTAAMFGEGDHGKEVGVIAEPHPVP